MFGIETTMEPNDFNSTIQNDCICPPVETITIYNRCSLTEWGIFLSSIILASSAFITSVLGQIQKSRCKTINCVGTKCTRDIEN
jgi:hypothetical protein